MKDDLRITTGPGRRSAPRRARLELAVAVGVTAAITLAACVQKPEPAWHGTAERPAVVKIDGEIIGSGPKCLMMRGNDGRLYGLRGPTGGVRVGDRVEAHLRAAAFDYCYEGLTVWVVSLDHPSKDE